MHLQTEVGNMCNNIKNSNIRKFEVSKSANQSQQSDNNMSQGSGRTGQCGSF